MDQDLLGMSLPSNMGQCPEHKGPFLTAKINNRPSSAMISMTDLDEKKEITSKNF